MNSQTEKYLNNIHAIFEAEKREIAKKVLKKVLVVSGWYLYAWLTDWANEKSDGLSLYNAVLDSIHDKKRPMIGARFCYEEDFHQMDESGGRADMYYDPFIAWIHDRVIFMQNNKEYNTYKYAKISLMKKIARIGNKEKMQHYKELYYIHKKDDAKEDYQNWKQREWEEKTCLGKLSSYFFGDYNNE